MGVCGGGGARAKKINQRRGGQNNTKRQLQIDICHACHGQRHKAGSVWHDNKLWWVPACQIMLNFSWAATHGGAAASTLQPTCPKQGMRECSSMQLFFGSRVCVSFLFLFGFFSSLYIHTHMPFLALSSATAPYFFLFIHPYPSAVCLSPPLSSLSLSFLHFSHS